MTGLTSALLEDFKVMREVKQLTHSDAPVKARECGKLLTSIMENRQVKTLLDDMDIQFS